MWPPGCYKIPVNRSRSRFSTCYFFSCASLSGEREIGYSLYSFIIMAENLIILQCSVGCYIAYYVPDLWSENKSTMYNERWKWEYRYLYRVDNWSLRDHLDLFVRVQHHHKVHSANDGNVNGQSLLSFFICLNINIFTHPLHWSIQVSPSPKEDLETSSSSFAEQTDAVMSKLQNVEEKLNHKTQALSNLKSSGTHTTQSKVRLYWKVQLFITTQIIFIPVIFHQLHWSSSAADWWCWPYYIQGSGPLISHFCHRHFFPIQYFRLLLPLWPQHLSHGLCNKTNTTGFYQKIWHSP